MSLYSLFAGLFCFNFFRQFPFFSLSMFTEADLKSLVNPASGLPQVQFFLTAFFLLYLSVSLCLTIFG